MQHKRILIVSYYFAPQNLIGAVRPTKLAKYLARMGHDVTVICGTGLDGAHDPTLQRDLNELKDVHIIREWNPLRALKARKAAAPAAAAAAPAAAESAATASGAKALVRRAIDVAYRYLRWESEESFRRGAIRELRRMGGSYDIVFSSYAPVGAHETARWAKKHGMAKRWIADFRDEVGFAFQWQNGRKERFLRMLSREADVLCGVSAGIMEMMGFQGRSRVLHNGFDREDLPAVSDESVSDGQLRVVYCGQFNMGRKGVPDRDISPMFRALRTLIDEGLLRKDELRLIYAGREGALFTHYAAASGLEDCVEDNGQVSRERSIALQRSADILLMASWHMASQKGILTGKLFEYIMMDKPIVCCMSGELPNSGVKQVLADTGMGLCCEQAGGAPEEALLVDYVRRLVQQWRAGGDLLAGRNDSAVEAYAYPGLAQTLESWIEE